MFKSKVRWIDIKAILFFSLASPIAFWMKLIDKNIWLFSERPHEARDNGYWLYSYTKEKYPKQRAYYVIRKRATDRTKVEKYGQPVWYGSFLHYIIYLAANCHVSAHIDSDSPNSRVSNFLETHRLLSNKRVFLQHGITKDKISFGYYNVSRADLFVCAAKPEWEFCKKEFGYPDGTVQLLGFARYDGLGRTQPKRQILFMPTWRAWLADTTKETFVSSEYFKKYQSLLGNEQLCQILEKFHVQLVFFPHSDMQKFVHLFKTNCSNITILSGKDYEVQTLLNESIALVTDYSSVAFDMAYMSRPICYYHFDYNKYRTGQHPEGYYSYEKAGFGEICTTENQLVNAIELMAENEFVMQQMYQKRKEGFFTFFDTDNCQRIYGAIQTMMEK